VGTLARKKHNSIVSKKRKKRNDENFDVVAKLTAYAT
jgi:hypothetical protein